MQQNSRIVFFCSVLQSSDYTVSVCVPCASLTLISTGDLWPPFVVFLIAFGDEKLSPAAAASSSSFGRSTWSGESRCIWSGEPGCTCLGEPRSTWSGEPKSTWSGLPGQASRGLPGQVSRARLIPSPTWTCAARRTRSPAAWRGWW